MSRLSILVPLAALSACVPSQEGKDQCPDVNYDVTSDKAPEQSLATHASIDAYMDAYLSSHPTVPGCSVAIVRDAQIWYEQGYGLADVQTGREMTRMTPLPIGSMSKTMTAAAVMRLQDEGLLDVDDRVSDHLSLPNDKREITIRQALSHQAGLPWQPVFDPSYDELSELDALYPSVENPVIWPGLVLPAWIKTTPLSATPGSAAGYSNAGFMLLGALIEAVTARDEALADLQSYERFVWAVAASAGEEARDDAPVTSCLRDAGRDDDIPLFAPGYRADANGDLKAVDWVQANVNAGLPAGAIGPAGGWTMTAGDYARFLIGLDQGHILSDDALAEMMTRQVQVPNVNNVWYGLGVGRDDQNGLPAWHHGGTLEGYRSRYTYWPDEDLGVVILCNGEPGDLGTVVNDLGLAAQQVEYKAAADWVDISFVSLVRRLEEPRVPELWDEPTVPELYGER